VGEEAVQMQGLGACLQGVRMFHASPSWSWPEPFSAGVPRDNLS
jgi:hypothetical protein